jgi:hypothetical protein
MPKYEILQVDGGYLVQVTHENGSITFSPRFPSRILAKSWIVGQTLPKPFFDPKETTMANDGEVNRRVVRNFVAADYKQFRAMIKSLAFEYEAW